MTDEYATGGFVSGPKPGDPPFLTDGCTFWLPEPMPAPPGLTFQINTDLRSIYDNIDPDALKRFYQNHAERPPIAPIRFTQDQLEQVTALVGEPVVAPASLSSVPIEIVDRVEDSTPYQQRREKLKAAFEAAMRVPYPQIEPGSEP